MPKRYLAATLVTLMLAAVAPFATTATAYADTASDASSAFINDINNLRTSKGLAPLQANPELTTIATTWAQNMANAGTISHNMNLPKQVTADWQKLGENVGVGGDETSLFNAFVASPEHYRNLVDPDFRYIGVATIVTADGRMYTSHEFMQLRAPVATRTAPVATAPAHHASTATAPAAAAQPASAAPAPPASVAVPVAPSAPQAPDHMLLSLEQTRDLASGYSD